MITQDHAAFGIVQPQNDHAIYSLPKTIAVASAEPCVGQMMLRHVELVSKHLIGDMLSRGKAFDDGRGTSGELWKLSQSLADAHPLFTPLHIETACALEEMINAGNVSGVLLDNSFPLEAWFS